MQSESAAVGIVLFPGDQSAVVPGRGTRIGASRRPGTGSAADPEASGTLHPEANVELSAGVGQSLRGFRNDRRVDQPDLI